MKVLYNYMFVIHIGANDSTVIVTIMKLMMDIYTKHIQIYLMNEWRPLHSANYKISYICMYLRKCCLHTNMLPSRQISLTSKIQNKYSRCCKRFTFSDSENSIHRPLTKHLYQEFRKLVCGMFNNISSIGKHTLH